MEIARVCRKAKPGIRIKRARFSAIIAQYVALYIRASALKPLLIRQIHHAAQHPVELDRRQADAVEARILLDLKVGAAFTRLQTLILQGRVPQIEAEKSVVSYGQLNSVSFPSYLTTSPKAHVNFQLLASSFKDTLRSRTSFPKISGISISR